ncbi:unnamed protein product, partial [Mesorhabditis belari]|uniref:Tyrosinase copper-binding domain-containing protein n=1 Tax=Mesorhabditis belari TaxID=2138241 RepID=A0AAF3EDJ9_9BILA
MFIFISLLLLIAELPINGQGKEFSTEEISYMNGHKYYGRSEQPYFRVKHKKHWPIELIHMNDSDFGKHRIPDDDVWMAHDWTEEELKYMHCLDLLCLCPYYNGSVLDDVCVLPNGDELKPMRRKEYRTLSDDERTQLEKAFRAMHDSGIYNRLGRVHKYGGVHSGPGFFPWHREFLKRFEFILRRFLPMGSNLGLPYWDSVMDAYLPNETHSIIFSKYLTGDHNENHEMVYGPYARMKTMEGNPLVKRYLGHNKQGELITEARIDVIMDQQDVVGVLSHSNPLMPCSLLPRFKLDERFFEYTHDYVHYFIGGDFEETHTSTNDIIFYFHHTFVDFIWEMWRQKIQTKAGRESEYPPNDPYCYPPNHFYNASMDELPNRRIRDGLSNNYTDNLYTYEMRPRCTHTKPNCGSNFLFCDTENFDRPKCQSKIKFGGNCTGYEKFAICYDGICLNGYCREEPSFWERLWLWIKRLLRIE